MFRSLRLSFVCCPASDLRNYVRYVQILLPPHRKSVSESKNMMSDFAPEAANSPNVAPNPKVVQNGV